MQKKLMSTLLLFAIMIGFGIWSVAKFTNATDTDGRIEAFLYIIPAMAALVAIVLLPFRHGTQKDG